MDREIIRPQSGQPLIVKLDHADGVEREGKYGVDWQYTVNDDAGVMWLPPAGRDAILRSGAQAGDSVEIVKAKRGKDYVFSARVVGETYEQPAIQQRVQPIPQRAYYASNGHGSNGTNGNGYHDTPAPARSEARPNGHAGRIAMCLRAAIDATIDATEYAKSKGHELAFNEEDVRAIALTIFIQAAKEAR